MIAWAGQAALVVALAVSLVLGTLPLWAAARGQARGMALARPLAAALCTALAAAFGLLVAGFVLHDFSLAAVAQHSHSRLPLVYRVTAVWGGHAGSMLLWLLVLAGWTALVARGSAALPATFAARLLAVLGLVTAGFVLFVLATSNPFATLSPAPADGADLNPLLQDPGMIAHPPLLYAGYVGFAVAFAWAVAVLLEGRLEPAWARWLRPWASAAWGLLTLGIALGSFWAYYELGWGGWWFWDPVENASFMPWLAGTALLHTLAVAEKRGALRAWTVLLAIATFALSLLGTFLVRSGVVSSVHSFASDPARGLFILVLLALVVGVSLLLYAWRAPTLATRAPMAALSRESALLANNLLFVVALATVMLGTLYPLALEAFSGDRVSVGAPYFETVLAPLFALVMALLGAGALAGWKHADGAALAWRLRGPLAASLVAGAAFFVLVPRASPGTALGIALAMWIVASIAEDARARRGAVTAGLAGMWLAHAGVAVFALGVALVNGLQSERQATLAVGESLTLADHSFTFHGVRPLRGANYGAVQALVVAIRGDAAPIHLLPEKRLYDVRRLAMTEAAIDRGLTRDLYVSLGEPVAGGAWVIRVQHKPFIGWVWGGCVLMALGGALAAADRRLRRPRPLAAAVVQEATA